MLAVDQTRIRNFAIIAHVDHGKSTLADRFIQLCGGLDAREMKAQVLDPMDFERERDFIAREKLTAGMDVVYLNQDSLVPGAGSLEGVFKDRLLGASEE